MKNKKGFTLIELIVVLAILAIIMAIAVPTAFGSIERARDQAAVASVGNIKGAVDVARSLANLDDKVKTLKPGESTGVIFYKDGVFVNGHSKDDKYETYYANALTQSGIKIEKGAFVAIVVGNNVTSTETNQFTAITYSKNGYNGSGISSKPNYPYYQFESAIEGKYKKFTSEGKFEIIQ